jgi:hypothetical protein
MSKTIEFTPEQTRAYNRFIIARDRIYKRNKKWVRASVISHTVDVAGLNHPLYVINDEYLEYVEAFKQWLEVEPKSREAERMRSSRGDYGTPDNWDEKPSKVKELCRTRL